MSSFGVKSFRNRDNFAKYLLFYYETGTRVLLTTLRWLHEGSVEDFVLKLPKKNWNGTESTTLEDLKNGLILLEDFDLSFLYKIIRLTDVFSGEDDILWTKRCPKFRRVELPHLLFILKTGRNNLAHPSKEQKNLTDLDVKNKSEEMKHLLTFILEKAGERGNVSPLVISELIEFVENDIQRIYRDENTDSSISPHVKSLIVNDLKNLDDDDDSYSNVLKSYSIPYFQVQDNLETSYQLNNIFSICDKAPVIVVTGEAGDGKSAMTRFLFNSWIDGKMEVVDNLSTFDIVLRVECRRIGSRDVSQFLEDHLPTSSYSFLNTSTLKRHLVPLRVLWIMDGYDERTPEFDGFLAAILQELSDKHKIIITTRPNTLKDLQKLLSKMDGQTICLEKLRDENLDEIINHLIGNSNDRNVFKSEINSLDDAGKALLRTPLNMTLYTELWRDDPSMAKGSYTTEILYTKATHLQLNRLYRRLEGRTNLPSTEDLIMKIDQWFYGSFCREAFLLAVQGFHIIDSETVNTLKKSANAFLVPSYCLSSFLVDEKGRNGTIKYDFQHTTQISVLASMFIKNMDDYPDINILKLLVDFRMYSTYAAVLNIVQFYLKIILEDNSINEDTDHIFFGIRKIISFFRLNEQCDLWLGCAIASNFTAKFMNLVSQTMEEIPLWAVEAVDSFSAVAKFLKYFKLKKIRLRVSNTLQPTEAKELMEVFEVLRDKQIEVHIHTLFDDVDNIIGTSGIDKINEMPLKIVAFTGSMTEFSLLRNHHENLRSLEIIISSKDDLMSICKFLDENDSLYLFQVKIYINCEDSFLKSPEILPFPRSFINVTTLVMVNLNRTNFKEGVLFLSKLKGDNTSKFASLHLPQEDKFVDLFTESEDRILRYFSDEVEEDPNANCLGLLNDTFALQVAQNINYKNSNLDYSKILKTECTLVNDTTWSCGSPQTLWV